MTTYPPLNLHNTFHIGKYIGEGVGAIIEKDPKYVKWMIENKAIDVSVEVVDKLNEVNKMKNATQETETIYVDTIMWESTNDMDRIVYSKKHYSEDGITTLCGKAVPSGTADVYGTYGGADCKRCQKKAEKLNAKIN